MKLHLPMLCVMFAALPARAQFASGNGPAPPPAADYTTAEDSAHPELNGKCKAVRPGDIVHYTLTIHSVEEARFINATLQMHLGRSYTFDRSGLPPPDFRTLGGGSVATRDASSGNDYHFSFVVPRDVLSGIYHGSGVYVTATENAEFADAGSRGVDVTKRTLKKIRDYCLIVVSPYGGGNQPLVTNFKGGPVERRVASTNDGSANSRIYLPTR